MFVIDQMDIYPKYVLDLLHLDQIGIRPSEIRPNGYKPSNQDDYSKFHFYQNYQKPVIY